MQAKVPGFQYENLTKWPWTCEHDGVRKAGFEMGFGNTAPYGDSFDAITPDFADQTSFRRIIPAYKAAIMVGKFEPNPGMAEILVDYVRNGGTLVINTQQLDGGYPREFTGVELTGETLDSGDYVLDQVKLAGAKVIRADAAGNPLFTRNAFGKGSVIVTTPRMLIPKSKQDWIKFRDDALSGKSKFEHIEALLELLCAEFVPVNVEGDIGFGLNKNSTGWWLYLFNHKGVMKLAGQAEWFDQERTAKVKIDLSRLNIKSVKELRGGEMIPLANNTLTMNIAAGDFKILELKK